MVFEHVMFCIPNETPVSVRQFQTEKEQELISLLWCAFGKKG